MSRTIRSYLMAGLTTGWLVGLTVGVYLAAANPIRGVGNRLVLVLGSGFLYALLAAVPATLVLLALGRLRARTRSDSEPSTADGILVAGALVAAGSLLPALRALVSGSPADSHAMSPSVAGLVAATAIGGSWLLARVWRRLTAQSGALREASFLLLAGLAVASVCAVWPGRPYAAPGRQTNYDYEETEQLTAERSERVALLGFDGLDPSLLDALIAADQLPTFAALRDRGVYSKLETLPAGFSPPIWATMATGVDATEHGHFDFLARRVALSDLDLSALAAFPPGFGTRTLLRLLLETPLVRETVARPRDRNAPALWTISSLAGVETCVIDWMATWPSEPVLGTMVSDRAFLAWNIGSLSVSTGDDALPQRLQGDREMSGGSGIPKGLCTPEPYCRQFFPAPASARERVEPSDAAAFHLAENLFYLDLAERVLEAHSCDFFVFYSHLPDFVNHTISPEALENVLAGDYRGEHESLMLGVYQEVDRTLGELIDRLGPDRDVLVVSDHGVTIASDDRRKWVTHGFPAPDGVFLALPEEGASFDPPDSPSVWDVAPSTLSLLGLPVTTSMPGRVLALGPPRSAVKAIAEARITALQGTVDDLQDEQELDEELKERLKALGYIQ